MNKRGSIWVWILIIIILILIIAGIYLWLSGGEISSVIPGAGIPKPPALPS